ncbi:unnamed protein product [Urochloa decumbens]|uniref:Germin-like protein n=1 Tax=Urochloa decumbens TaxID=240449 RepID=A0ABC9B987_9POAL
MASSSLFLVTVLLALVASGVIASSDPSPLQDFCVADKDSPVRVNGLACKDVKDVNVDDFFLAANLDKPMDTTLNKGLIHFQFNPSYDKPAVAIAALSSQNPGAITIANAVFGSKAPIADDVLAKAFQADKTVVDWLQAQFWEDNHN